MKISLSIFIGLFLLLSFALKISAQSVEFDETNFAGRTNQLNKALKEINKGNKILVGKVRKARGAGRYAEALKHYLVAYEINPDNAQLNYKIGATYLKSVEKYKAAPYLEKAYKLNKNVKDDINFLLGQAYHINYDFDKAILKYLEYEKSLNVFDKTIYGGKIEKKIQECRNGKDLVKNPVNVKITNLEGVVNTQYPEYSPIVNANKTIMFFTSRRPNTVGHRIDVNDGKYYEDIYISYFKDGAWTAPKNPGRPLNTRTHDAIVGISQDGRTLLTYKAKLNDNGDIYISNLKDDKYTKPKKLPATINTPYHETSATLSPDGSIIYFVSDREGGFGGRDIWMSKKDDNGNWGKAINLGPTINTSYNEEGVFMQADGKTLYFSSQGHNSMGGYDIFKTVYENGKWSVPRNLGYPINTPDDDVFLSITQDGRHGYYASAKKDGFGDLDIYDIDFYEVKGPENVLITGKVLDADTKLPVESYIEIRDKGADVVASNISSAPDNGNYFVSLPNNKDYILDVTAPDYEAYQEEIPKGKPLNKIIYIHKVKGLRIGYVYDSDTKKPVCGAKIIIKNYGALADSVFANCKTGEFHSDVLKGKDYDVTVIAPDYVLYTESIPPDKDVNKIIYIHKTKAKALVSGYVYDSETKQAVCGAKITIKNNGATADSLFADCSTGEYHSDVPKGVKYDVTVIASGYVPYNEALPVGKDVNQIIYIEKIQKAVAEGKLFDITSAKSFVLPDILYDLNKYDLKPQYQDSLNGLINTMVAFPNIVIELSSHTDTRGSDVYNDKLSYNRAKSVVDYLISKGIDADRMVAKGYGKRIPRVLDRIRYVLSCGKKYPFEKGTKITDTYILTLTGGKCETEAAHQLNRRTEFKVLREDFVPNKIKSSTPVNINVIK